ncbi:MAG TPA: hypothetical protein VFY32_05855 [Solirubrobacteraceae bacterium]|nr:hypothetical protein [Solirubrobacteraceae bacterium]
MLAYKRKDGLTSWYLRVRAHGRRHRINLGTELDGWTQARAQIELQNVLAKIQAGLWGPPAPQATALDDPTFHQFASSWLARRRPSYKQRTYEHYRYLLTHHLLPRVRGAAAVPAGLRGDRSPRGSKATRERGDS